MRRQFTLILSNELRQRFEQLPLPLGAAVRQGSGIPRSILLVGLVGHPFLRSFSPFPFFSHPKSKKLIKRERSGLTCLTQL